MKKKDFLQITAIIVSVILLLTQPFSEKLAIAASTFSPIHILSFSSSTLPKSSAVETKASSATSSRANSNKVSLQQTYGTTESKRKASLCDAFLPSSSFSGEVTFEGRTYAAFDDKQTWTDAENKCNQMGGYLATIQNKDVENFFLDTLLKNGQSEMYWLGANNLGNGSYQWVTGESLSYTNWGWGAAEWRKRTLCRNGHG